MQIIQALEDSDILLKGVTETTKNELKSQSGGALSMLLGPLGASLLGNVLSGWGMYRTGKCMYRTGKCMYRTGKGMYRNF